MPLLFGGPPRGITFGMTRRSLSAAFVGSMLALASSRPLPAQSGTVEEVAVPRLVQLTPEAFRHQVGVKAGDAWDPAKFRNRFRKLWELGVFEDLTLFVEDGPNGGKVLVFKVKERRTLTAISYEENKVLTRTAIEDALKEKKIRLETGKPVNLKTITAAEGLIR